jgi:hypothetical protein
MLRTGILRVRMACAIGVALLPALASADRPSRHAPRPAVVAKSEAADRGCTFEDALASQRAPATPLDSAPADAAVAAEAQRVFPPVLVAAAATPEPDVASHLVPLPADHEPTPAGAAPAAREMPSRAAPLRFFDRDSLRAQIKSIRRLPLVRLFDNRQMSIYLGIDRKGVAGLHLQQRRPDEAVPMDEDAAPVDIPLRSVPLDAR